jgi:hypothetical protein
MLDRTALLPLFLALSMAACAGGGGDDDGDDWRPGSRPDAGGGGSPDAGGDEDGSGALRMSWVIEINDEPATCGDAGIDHLYMTATDADGNDYTDETPCSAGLATMNDLPLGSYDVVLQARDANDEVKSTATRSGTIDVDGERVDLSPVVFALEAAPTLTAQLHATWSMTIDDEPADCWDVDVDTVIYVSTRLPDKDDPTDEGETFEDVFDCEDGGADLAEMPLGDYEVHVRFEDSWGDLRGETSNPISTALTTADSKVSLPNIRFNQID